MLAFYNISTFSATITIQLIITYLTHNTVLVMAKRARYMTVDEVLNEIDCEDFDEPMMPGSDDEFDDGDDSDENRNENRAEDIPISPLQTDYFNDLEEEQSDSSPIQPIQLLVSVPLPAQHISIPPNQTHPPSAQQQQIPTPLRPPSAQQQTSATPLHPPSAQQQTSATPLHPPSAQQQTSATPLHTPSAQQQTSATPLHPPSAQQQTSATPLHPPSAQQQTSATPLHPPSAQQQTSATPLHPPSAQQQTSATPLHPPSAQQQTSATPLHPTSAQQRTTATLRHPPSTQQRTTATPRRRRTRQPTTQQQPPSDRRRTQQQTAPSPLHQAQPPTNSWSTTLQSFTIKSFSSYVGPTVPVPETASEIFSLMFTEPFLDQIVAQTNLYAKQTMGEEKYDKWDKITREELKSLHRFLHPDGNYHTPSSRRLLEHRSCPALSCHCRQNLERSIPRNISLFALCGQHQPSIARITRVRSVGKGAPNY